MTQSSDRDVPAQAPAAAKRKPYRPPELVFRGTIEELTRALIGAGSDNFPNPPNGSRSF